MRLLVAHQHLLLLLLWIWTTIVSVQYYLIAVLISISLITHYVEHLFMGLFAICRSALVECLLWSLAALQQGCLFSYC